MSRDNPYCFIITPYGNPKGDESEKQTSQLIENFISNIIRPTEERIKAEGLEWDMIVGRDRATEDGLWKRIGSEIATAETVIAVIASEKPNTYLELGLAYGLWLRPILIQLGGFAKPTDLEGMTWVHISAEEANNPSSSSAPERIDELVRLLNQISEEGRRRAPEMLDKRTTSYGLHSTFSRFNAIPISDWANMISEAQEFVSIVLPKGLKVRGRSFGATGDEEQVLTGMIRRKTLEDGVPFTLIINHPSNITPAYLKPIGDIEVHEFQKKLVESFEKWSRLEKEVLQTSGRRLFRVVQARGIQLQYRATITERRLLLTPRFISEQFDSHHTIDAPSILGTEDSPSVYEMYRSEIERLSEIPPSTIASGTFSRIWKRIFG